jgi:cytosine/adenosine deaminase-related metal-dependent hydrolase
VDNGTSENLVLSARWVFPVAGPPLERGTVTIRGGIILAVGLHGERAADLDLGNCAIIPGLVNAHTHLDLSGLRGKAPPRPDFTGWLKDVIAHRRTRSPDQVREDVEAGLTESLRFGTTLLGDIAAEGSTYPLLADAPCDSVVFRELLGLPGHRAMTVWKDAARWLDEHPDTDQCWTGLSPHAPYSIHHALLRAAGHSGAVQTIHFLETAAERELLDHHRGPFADFLRELGVWDEDGLAPSHEWILWRMEAAPSLLLAHGNFLAPDTPLPRNATVVYCPRTHAAFGHPPHPFRELLARGIRVALGTDSLASNPNLDLLAEARFIHERYPDFPGDQILRLATLAGAEALGRGHSTGSLEPGKLADLVAVPLPDVDAGDPFRLLLEPGAAELPRRAMWRGMWRKTASGPGG